MCKPTAQDAQSLREKQNLKKIYEQLGLTQDDVQYLVKNGLHEPKALYKYCRESSEAIKMQDLSVNYPRNQWVMLSGFMIEYYRLHGTYGPLTKNINSFKLLGT